LEGFGAALEFVESFDVLVGVGVGRGRVVVPGRDAVAFALLAQCERFVLDDGLEPGDEVVGAGGGRLREQDLEAALVGVFGVFGCGGVAPRGGHDLGAVAADELERGRFYICARRTVRVYCSAQHSPRGRIVCCAKGAAQPVRPRGVREVPAVCAEREIRCELRAQ
jgi:hypothetical protein